MIHLYILEDQSISSSMKLAIGCSLIFLLSSLAKAAARGGGGGWWELLLNNSGVVAMHMALTHYNTVVMFDQNTYNRSAYSLHPRGRDCSPAAADADHFCWAHSVEYDIASNSLRPLVLRTDTWCSSGAFLPDGTLLQVGGNGTGIRRIRYFRPHGGWSESRSYYLADDRWYATTQLLPEGRAIVVGGKKATSYEFVPRHQPDAYAYDLPFLRDTQDPRNSYQNLYPIVHLSSDGNLFIFANQDSILFDYQNNQVIRTFPRIPGDSSRNYPSTGSSVMLPLDHADGFRRVEVLVCGGGARNAFAAARRRHPEYLVALTTCGRIVVTDDDAGWEMEDMPGPRIMNDMLILPTGHILIINGATRGVAGWQMSTNASYAPFLYHPEAASGQRFSVLRASGIARMYHSSAIVIPDGRVLVAGSNPHMLYDTTADPYPTELRVEAFSPGYMDRAFDGQRPTGVVIGGGGDVRYGAEFRVVFAVGRMTASSVAFHTYKPPFATHSQSLGQRMLKLECRRMERDGEGRVRAVVVAPPSPVVAPSGYYLFTVVSRGIPSPSVWVRFF